MCYQNFSFLPLIIKFCYEASNKGNANPYGQRFTALIETLAKRGGNLKIIRAGILFRNKF